MNSLKTLVVLAMLAAVGYGVYVSITRNPRQLGNSGIAPAWPTTSKAPITGPAVTMPQPTATGSAAGLSGGGSNSPPAGGLMSAADRGAAPVNSSGGGSAGSGSGLASLGPPLPGPATLGSAQVMPSEGNPPAFPANGYPAIASNAVASGRSAESEVHASFTSFMQDIQTQLDSNRLDESLRSLSALYQHPSVPPAQARQISELLDQLAGTVIYSRQHLLEPPYRVQAGEKLDQIAQKYNVPYELLARINGVGDPANLRPGQELKVLRGPFSAIVRLDRYELTLVLQDRYAGRFPIGIGRDRQRLDGTYTVRDRIVGPTYSGPDGVNISPTDPNNPLGKLCIDLDGQIGIHGTNDPQAIGRADNRGFICLGERDIHDLFAILSIGSRVVIER